MLKRLYRDIGIFLKITRGDDVEKTPSVSSIRQASASLEYALRKAITLSMSRPVKIKRIEKEINTQFRNRGDTIIKEIEDGIVYLRKERFFKTDAANLLVGSVRGLGSINRQIALDLGFKFLPELPDMRVIRTMVSFLDDTTEKKKIFNVLKYPKDKNYVRNVRNIVKIPDIESKFSALPPWTFEMTETVKLERNQFFSSMNLI